MQPTVLLAQLARSGFAFADRIIQRADLGDRLFPEQRQLPALPYQPLLSLIFLPVKPADFHSRPVCRSTP